MSLYDKIMQDKIAAMKTGDLLTKQILTVFQGEITTLAKKVNKDIDDKMCTDVLQKIKKSLVETLQYNPKDADKTNKEIGIVSNYLPKMFTESEIKAILFDLNFPSLKDAFTFFSSNYKGQYDSKIIQEYFKNA